MAELDDDDLDPAVVSALSAQNSLPAHGIMGALGGVPMGIAQRAGSMVADAGNTAPSSMQKLPPDNLSAAPTSVPANPLFGAASGGAPDPDVQSAIAKQYGFGSGLDTAALMAAQKTQQQNNYAANMGEAGNDLADAFARGRGGGLPAGSDKFYQNLRDQAAQPVQNIMALRQAKLSDMTASNQFADNDPNSPVSKAVQDAYVRLGFPEDSVRQLSSADLKNIQSPADLAAKLQAQKDTKALGLAGINANKQIALGQKNDKLEQDFANNLMQHNDPYKEANSAYTDADALITRVQDATTNKTSAQSLATELANFASKGKRLHTATVDAFLSPNSDLMSRINTAVSRSQTGTIPPDVANDVVNYLQSEKQAAGVQRQQAMGAAADQFKDINGSYPRIYHPDSPPSAQAAATPTPRSAAGMHAPGSTVYVKGKGSFIVGSDGNTLTPAGGGPVAAQ